MILDAVARRYGTDPWAIVSGSWLGYQFNVGVLLVALDEEQRQQPDRPGASAAPPRPKPGKRAPAPRVSAPVGSEGYADPTALTGYAGVGIKKMTIPEDGIW